MNSGYYSDSIYPLYTEKVHYCLGKYTEKIFTFVQNIFDTITTFLFFPRKRKCYTLKKIIKLCEHHTGFNKIPNLHSCTSFIFIFISLLMRKNGINMDRYHPYVNLWCLVAFKQLHIKKVYQTRHFNAKISLRFMCRVAFFSFFLLPEHIKNNT